MHKKGNSPARRCLTGLFNGLRFPHRAVPLGRGLPSATAAPAPSRYFRRRRRATLQLLWIPTVAKKQALMPDGDSFPLFCSRGVRFVGACPPKRTVNAFLSCKKRTLIKNPPQGIPAGDFYGILWSFPAKRAVQHPTAGGTQGRPTGRPGHRMAVTTLPGRVYPAPASPQNGFSAPKKARSSDRAFFFGISSVPSLQRRNIQPSRPCYRQMEMITGTTKEQIMPLSTDSTTVSSLVYFSIMGRVVSSLVAPAGAMLV